MSVQPVIGIDFDDVLVHTSSRVRSYLRDCFPHEEIRQQRPTFDFSSFFVKPKSLLIKDKFLTELVWNGEKFGLSPCFVSHQLWVDATCMNFIFRLSKSRKFRLVIASKRNDKDLIAEFLEINGISNYFSEIFAGVKNKSFLPIDALVDDYPKEFFGNWPLSNNSRMHVIVPKKSYNEIFNISPFIYVDMDKVYNRIVRLKFDGK